MKKKIRVRASSFGTLFDCAHRFEGEQLLKLYRASSLRAWLGTSIHASTAAFDQARIEGKAITANDAADVFVSSFWNPSEEVDFKDAKLTRQQAELIGLKLHAKYCAEIAPAMHYESVEMALRPLEIDCGGDLTIVLTGTMDRARVARMASGKVISDVKTGGRLIDQEGIVTTKGRAAQLGTYQLLSEHTDGEETSGGQIIALQTTTAAPVGVSKVFDAKRVMVGDENQEGLISMAAKIFKIGLFTPNPMSQLCDKKYCARWGTCAYKG